MLVERLALRITREQQLGRRCRRKPALEHPVHRLRDRHFDRMLRRKPRHLARRARALGDVSEAGEDLRQLASARQLQSHTAVARQIAGRREDQISRAREAHEGFGPPSERPAQARDFGQAARDERGASVLAEFETIADADRDGHHVLDRARDLDADQIGAVVDAQPAPVQQPRGAARELVVAQDLQIPEQTLD